MSSDDPFDDSPVSRRRFMQLSAAAGAALTLPGNATAEASDAAFSTEYQYVLNHTPEDYEVPTLIRFSDASGPTAMEGLLDVDTETITTPEPAGYAQLTTTQASTLAELPSASEFQFAPGSNPFWRIGYYPAGVFPEPRRSVDFIGFEQLKDGLDELQSRYPDRVNVRTVGRSPGHTNNVTDRPDPKEMIVVEVTNDVQDRDAFREKEKVFHSCSLHGLEAAGREAGARVIENVARGSEPDIDGNNAKIEPLLDDAVLLLGFTNPDGWAVRNPQYDSGWQVGGPGTGLPRAPGAPLFERGNAEIYDTNRQYPTVGAINPAHYPAYVPEDAGPDDVPSFVYDKVPDAAAFVEFFRGYENLNYGSDLHGGPVFNEFVLGLISQDQFDTRELHELYEMCLAIDETLEAALTKWTTAGDVRTQLLGDEQYAPLFGVLPTEAFDYATIYDTIGYTVSGAMLDWMAHPEPVGLDMTTLDFEMSFSHMTGGNVYNPELLEMEVKGYRTAIRTITAFAVRNSGTPNTADSFETTTETDGETVAYVTTEALRRTDDDLVFESEDDSGGDGSDGGGGLPLPTTVTDAVAAEGVTTVSETVSGSDLHSMQVHLHAENAVMDAELLDPDGNVVRSFDGVTDDRVGGKCCGFPEWTVSDPAPGEWTIRLENLRELEQPFEAYFGTLASQSPNPDPRSVDNWGGEGYEQLEYDVTPFDFFEDYDEFIEDGGSVEAVTVEDVADGALADYDHAVVIHDYGANADADYIGSDLPGYTPRDHPEAGFDEDGYVAALDDFVDSGGNLVLTDTGVNLLTELDNALVSADGIDRGAVTADTPYDVARFTSKNDDHPLLTDVRPIQEQLWKVAPLGYQVSGSAPMHRLAQDAFTSAANEGVASVAGLTDGAVTAGSITESADSGRGVHVVASLLPPSTQANLHPFGLQSYTVTFLGNLLLTSALGFQQVRDTADTTRVYGRGDEWSVDSGVGATLSASGSRAVDSSVTPGGRANRVAVTVDSVDTDAESVEIRDSFPPEWDLLESLGEGTKVDDGVVSFGTFDVEDLPSGDGDSKTFTYFIESPDSPENTNAYEVGPAEALATVDGEDISATFAPASNVVAVGVSL